MECHVLIPCCIFIIFYDVAESLNLQGKLLGGERSSHLMDSYYKYMSSLIFNNTLFCTAVIASTKHLLTAGHCISDMILAKNVEKLRHSYALISTDETGLKRPYFLQQVEAHPDCDLETYSPAYDIAVVTLVTVIQFSIPFIPLKDPVQKARSSQECIIPGWECILNADGYDCDLKFIEGMARSLTQLKPGMFPSSWMYCDILFSLSPANNGILQSRDAGTLVMSQKALRPKGILSFVPKEKDVPALYVHVKYFTKWINDAKANREHEGRDRKLLNLLSMDSENMPGLSAGKELEDQNDLQQSTKKRRMTQGKPHSQSK